MLEEQAGLCAICRRAPAAHVDHDHLTGAVRALLCFNCNGGLGQFKDDPAVLRAAAEYVERHRNQRRPQPMRTRRTEVHASVGGRRASARRWPELRRQAVCSPIERRLADFLAGR